MSTVAPAPVPTPRRAFDGFVPPCGTEPIRAELYGPERLEAQGRALAESSVVSARRAMPSLLQRFEDNSRVLIRSYRRITEAGGRPESLGPDAEWIADNFHVIEEVLREIRLDLPRGFYGQLPRLADGPLEGYPRTYALALSLIAHTDSNLDETHLVRYVQAYQSAAPLTIGELWAVPTMLRLGLLENLRRLAEQMLAAWDEHALAERWTATYQHVVAAGGNGPPGTNEKRLTDSFVAGLVPLLRDPNTTLAGAVTWLEEHLTHHGTTAGECLGRERQRQAANQVSIGNCVTSLRLLSALNWNAFFEKASRVEVVLRGDPAGVYARQDFATRDRQRRVVERLARGSGRTEVDVARRAMALAGAAPDAEPRQRHVGYYLTGGPGLDRLAAEVRYRPRPRDWAVDFVLHHPGGFYFGGLLAVGLALLAPLAAVGWQGGPALALLTLVAGLVPASEVAVAVVNYLVTLLLPPRVLPKLDFKQGIPPDCATVIVVPSLLTSEAGTAALVERLELHYLTNPDAGLRFALLTDFADAPAETMPADAALVRQALAGIRALNLRHPRGEGDRFFLFHRRRVWNPVQACWMGWERKRGKLDEFNRLLRGAEDTTYETLSGPPAELAGIRFVLTLDSDTQLPRETARRLVATLAHPLNQARFDPEKGRVVEGYGVLQPRVSFHLGAGGRTLFARTFAASKGLDPYAAAISDVYQDLFGAGSYTGKGLYDVDAFHAAVGRAFPDNHILSHDLIESSHARCGLVSDVEVMDDFPARYHTYARREHRWARGDWQLLPWLLPTVPTTGPTPDAPRGRRRNPLPLLERWKVLDNLRRTLVPPALVILLVLGWTVLPGSAWAWTGLSLLILALPLLLLGVGVIGRSIGKLSWQPIAVALHEDVGPTAGQVALATTFLLDQARLMTDAAVRTLTRLFVTRRHLLEWETAAATESRLGGSLSHFGLSMWPTVLTAGLLTALVVVVGHGLLPALPFLAAWLLSPLVAFLVSRTPPPVQAELSAAARQELRCHARRTWNFFETFVGEADHWLPPDNYQEDPKGQIAHRTSPTNQGLLLLSTLAAHDLGYLGKRDLADRLEKTFDTLDRLERFRGHFHNWYETQTLKSLPPGYVSTVDSGNLLACLLALAQGLREKAAEASPNPALADGLTDTFSLLTDAVQALEPSARPQSGEVFDRLNADMKDLALLLAERPADHTGFDAWLRKVEAKALDLPARTRYLAEEIGQPPEDLALWGDRFLTQVRAHLAEVGSDADASRTRLERLTERAEAMAKAMDFGFLYNAERHLFSIGYNLAQGKLDPAHYDLLASEACLASFLTVARGDAPVRHWFTLGRLFAEEGPLTVLLSWGGTMFEYLMPRLLLRPLPGTLLDVSCRSAVAKQIAYGRRKGVPWGISESAFNFLDGSLDYQYRSFGVPGLGLKRGLAQDLVIAPYATALALAVQPEAALLNLRRLTAEGALDVHGFYEALDYTKERLAKGQRVQVIHSHMAHHQGMILVALDNALLDDVMPRRFHSVPVVRSAEMLLQERVPVGATVFEPHEAAEGAHAAPHERPQPMARRLTTANTPTPRTHLLSNGRYTVALTNAGGGFSRCDGLDVTRWREDRTLDSWGQFLYVRDLGRGLVWSATYQPLGREPDSYEVLFSADKADFRRRDSGVETHLEVTVSPEKNVEVRQLTLTNTTARPLELEVTSFAELVLNPHAADLSHPAFGNLFLETEWVPKSAALLCHRRARSSDQKPVCAFHAVAVDGLVAGPPQYETDRNRFLGRHRTPADPRVLESGAMLSGTVGAVLDPVFSLRQRLRLAPGSTARLAFSTGVAESCDEAMAMTDRHHDLQAAVRSFELAWAHAQVELRHLQASAEDTHAYQRLAAHLLYAGPTLRAQVAVLSGNRQGQAALWRHGVSGDKPIVVARVGETGQLVLVRQLFAAHTYLRLKGLEFDLVVLNEQPGGYYDELQQQLLSLTRASDAHQMLDKPGGVFLRRAEQLSAEDRTLLLAAARAVFAGDKGTLGHQLDTFERAASVPPPLLAGRRSPARAASEDAPRPAPRLPDLQFDNGYGGFTPDGREYVIRLDPAAGRSAAPAPWVNVIANPSVGFLVSESGSGYTWAGNSQTNRLTPWSNDPVSDPPVEALYLRDETSGEVWSPTPLPVRSAVPTVVRHGQGYTVFQQTSHGLAQEVVFSVAPEEPVKLITVKIRNVGPEARRLSATYFIEWVLGVAREQMLAQTVTEVDPETGALLARNAFNPSFPTSVAFADVNVRPRTLTADRTEFLGRNGSRAAPAALARKELSGRTGTALDPCAAVQAKVALQAGQETEVVFLLGEAADVAEVRRLVTHFRDPANARAALAATRALWDRVLGTIQVRTPDRAMDLLLNRWLLYQVLSCRYWGRSAFYQSGGAYGFRDQLQDVMALVYALPAEARAHILRAASRQFLEGDVQHWWHPPEGRGVRTRFSDDFLWLPFVTCHYVETTGDAAILEERVPFLTAPRLEPGQEDSYGLPQVAEEVATLYEHCARALDNGDKLGEHGLPLMGIGDWNDGMNRVGSGGKGESVWDAWFQIVCLRRFALVAQARGDAPRATTCAQRIEKLRQAVETHAWDGAWYRRAYFDDGTPLGSAQNDECQIDSIVQSWAVLSGVADADRARQGMAALRERLVREAERLILLFTPPFDRGSLQPGYIKGYVPGIRENGGQYTHAATWVVLAEAERGRGTEAHHFFDLLNPIRQALTPEAAARFRVEPYALAGDVYGGVHTGRGGWTWYTGSAAWLYRAGLEAILGFRLRGDRLTLRPCIPADWPAFEMDYRHGNTTYAITVRNPRGIETGVTRLVYDGRPVEGDGLILVDDAAKHTVEATLEPA